MNTERRTFLLIGEKMVILLVLFLLSIHSNGQDNDIVITPGLIFNRVESVIFVNEEVFYLNLNIKHIFTPLTDLINYIERTHREINKKYTASFDDCRVELINLKGSALNIIKTLKNTIHLKESSDIPDEGYFETYLNSDFYSRILLANTMQRASTLPALTHTHDHIKIRKILYDVIYMYVCALNGIRTMISSFQREFLMMVRDRQLSPSLINKTELIRFISNALNKYHNSVIISYTDDDDNWKKYYSLCKITDIKIVENSVLLTVTIPIRALQKVVFDVYRIIPVYMSREGGYGYIVVEPRYRYLAVSSKRDWFTFMENLSECRLISRLEYSLCIPKREFIRNNNDDCIVGSFTRNPNTKCIERVEKKKKQ